VRTGDSRFQARIVLTVAGGHFLHDMFSSFLAPFLPLVIDKFSLSMVLAGLLTVFFRLPSLFNPFLGGFADRVDLRYLFILAPGATAMAISLVGVMPNYASICFLLLLAGVSAAIYHVVGPVVIARSAGGLVGRGMSLWMTAGELARTVGPIVAVAVVGWWGFERAYPVMIVGLVATGYMFLRLKDVSTVGPVRTSGSLIQTWRRLRPVMFPLAWLILARAFISATLINYLPTYMVGMGQSLWFGGVCLAVLELFGTAGTFFGGPLSDRAGRGRILWASMLTAPLFMLVFLNVHGWIVFPVLACLGISFFAGSPVMLALVQDHAKGSRATANGLFMGINFCIAALVLLLVGRLVDVLGFQTAFTLSACMGFVGLPAVFFLPRPVREDNIKK